MAIVKFPPVARGSKLSQEAAERLGIASSGGSKKPSLNVPKNFSPNTPHFSSQANKDTVEISPEAKRRLLKGDF